MTTCEIWLAVADHGAYAVGLTPEESRERLADEINFEGTASYRTIRLVVTVPPVPVVELRGVVPEVPAPAGLALAVCDPRD